MVQPKPKQWFGAELPWANYERYMGYVKAHRAEHMTVGKLIVAAVDTYLEHQPQEAEAKLKNQTKEVNDGSTTSKN